VSAKALPYTLYRIYSKRQLL